MFTLSIIVILMIFLVDTGLSVLNYRYRKSPIPQNISDMYNEKRHMKWLNYYGERFKLNVVRNVINLVVLLSFIIFGVLNIFAKVAQRFSGNTAKQTIIFLLLCFAVQFIMGTIFNLYGTFSIEQRYGFNRTTLKIYFSDCVKNLFFFLICLVPFLDMLVNSYILYGISSLFYSWVVWTIFVVINSQLYAPIFLKFFNTLTPLEDGELKDKTIALANNLGYEVDSISVMDSSKRSTRINAFFSGFGKLKRVVLYDSLLENCSTDEILSIIAHEIGHYLNKDTLKNLLGIMIKNAACIGILAFFLTSKDFSVAFGLEDFHIGLSILLTLVMYSPLDFIMNIILMKISRNHEYKADSVAVKAGYGDALIGALKTLYGNNFSNLSPHPLIVRIYYSHPTLSQRIHEIQKYNAKLSEHNQEFSM